MKITEVLSKEEISYFSRKSDLRGLWVVASTWASILALFYLAATWTNPITLLMLVLLLPGRMLALSIIMHDCGHKVLFKTDKLNHFFGQYLSANLVFSDMPSYAKGHLNHHKLAGTAQDPDLPNYKNYPVSKASFKRKLIRDMQGKTGFKLLRYVVRGALAVVQRDKRQFARPFIRELLAQLLFAIFLGLVFAPYMYLVWIGTYLTSYMVVVRLRQLAEHAAVPDLYDLDPRKNTRTVIPNWWEKLFLAVNNVNYHLEHHFMASVPCYRLPELHKNLNNKGLYQDAAINYGYSGLFRQFIAS